MSSLRLSDYVLDRVAEAGVQHVFLVPGGAAMYLDDAVAGRTDISFVANLHEHASAVAAEAYGKVTGNLGVALVTAGPGSTNCITGLASAWVNSAPVLFLSGQVKRRDMKGGRPLRQLGLQEVDTLSIVRPLTKYAATVTDPTTIRQHMDLALLMAREGRPGPVWLDLPLDVQSTEIDLDSLAPVEFPIAPLQDIKNILTAVEEFIVRARGAKRPILLLGAGIRIAGGADLAVRLVDSLGIPYATTWVGADLVGDEHPYFAGRPGAFAARGANFAVQNCDLLLTIGARWDFATTGFSPEGFARGAFRIAVDVDAAELDKLDGIASLLVQANAREFIEALIQQLPSDWDPQLYAPWVEQIHQWRKRYPIVTADLRGDTETLSTYVFVEELGRRLGGDDVVVQGSAGNYSEIFCMTFPMKKGQRLLCDGSFGAMGYGLPAAIGGALGSGRRTVLVDGDGSIMPNIQELETVRRLELPLKIMVVSNGGYASIRASQSRWFQRFIAADTKSGLTLPGLEQISAAFGIPFFRIATENDIASVLDQVFKLQGPALVEVRAPNDEERRPRLSNYQRADGTMVSKPLEDLLPFLPRDEFFENMIIPPLQE